MDHKALIPVTAAVLAAHALLWLGLPARHRPAPPQPVVMQTRTVELEPAPAPAPPPVARPAPARPQPAARPRAAPPAQPAPSAQKTPPPPSMPRFGPSTQPEPEPEPDPAPILAAPAPAASDMQAPSPEHAAPAEPESEPEASAQPASETASGLQITPAGGSALPPGAPLPVALPEPATLQFDAKGQVKGLQYSAGAELQWQHDGNHYRARQSIRMFLLGERAQTSEGLLTPEGLQPQRFTDQGRKTQTATFDLAEGKARFGDGTSEADIAGGMQDRLSVFVQLAALMAAAPERYPEGTVIELTAASARHADRWRFRVGPAETLELPLGGMDTVRLDKLPGRQGSDQQGAVWLAPALGYLPVRIRLTQGQGDYVDLRLKRYARP